MGASDLTKSLQSWCSQVGRGLLLEPLSTQASIARNQNTRTEIDEPSLHQHLSTSIVLSGETFSKTDEQLQRVRRLTVFARKGVPREEAEEIEARLVLRDHDLDDRRSCAECLRFEISKCQQLRQPVGGGGVEVLHRCKWFVLDEML